MLKEEKMTDEKEKELQKVKVDAYLKIKELQHRICRVGGYISGLQCQLSEHMDFYHQADRELAEEFKMKKVKPASKKLVEQDWVKEILADPVKSAKMFEQLEQLQQVKSHDTWMASGD
jgi:hypothetical protein